MTASAPGLFQIAPPTEGESIQEAVKAAFDDLDAKGLLGPIEKAKRAALVKAARALDEGMAYGRVSVAASKVLSQVLESLDGLPKPTEGTDRDLDAFDQALAALTADALGVAQ